MRNIKAFIAKHRIRVSGISEAIGATRQLISRRLAGTTAWTAIEVVQFHAYLESEGVSVDLGELTRACASDYRED